MMTFIKTHTASDSSARDVSLTNALPKTLTPPRKNSVRVQTAVCCRGILRKFAGLLTIGLFLPLCAATAQQTDQLMEYQSEAKVGWGWNSLTNRPSQTRGNCLDPDSYEISQSNADESSSGIIAEGSFKLVFSKSSIADGFGLNAAANYRSVAYEASGSAKYAQSKQVSAQNTNVAGYVKVETRSQSLRAKGYSGAETLSSDVPMTSSMLGAKLSGIRLSPDALAALNESPEKFFTNCGDGFVIDIYYGGRLNVLAELSTGSEESKRKLEESLKGAGGGATIEIGGFVEASKSSEVSSFSASFRAVGSDGTGIDVSDVDSLKDTFDKFPRNVKDNDRGVRIRVASYASLLPNSEQYQFGPTQEVIEAARLHNDLDSVWRDLADMRSGDLANELRWDLAVDKDCLGEKQDEIVAYQKRVKNNVTGCATKITSSLSTPGACGKAVFPANPSSSASATCPATTAVIDGQLSQFDYRMFYPLVKNEKVLPACKKYATGEVQQAVNAQWLEPIIDAQCNDDNTLRQCNNRIRQQLQNNIHVVDTTGNTAPIHPYGGYSRSCKNCTSKWDASGAATFQCSCAKNKEFRNTAWITMQCPQDNALQNCNRRLRYGNCP